MLKSLKVTIVEAGELIPDRKSEVFLPEADSGPRPMVRNETDQQTVGVIKDRGCSEASAIRFVVNAVRAALREKGAPQRTINLSFAISRDTDQPFTTTEKFEGIESITAEWVDQAAR